MFANRFVVGILDDDDVALTTISAFIRSYFESQKKTVEIQCCSNEKQLLSKVIPFDIFLCDIELSNGVNGIEIARNYIKKHENTAVIFVSNREDLVFDSLKVYPLAFVRKEHFFSDIRDALDHYLKNFEFNKLQKAILVKGEGASYRIKIDEIVFIEARLHEQQIHLSDGKIINAVENMKSFVASLEKYGFIQCHKSFLVNYSFIREIKQNIIIMTTGNTIYISRRHLKEIKEKFLKFNLKS